jgi:hypothetical protein
MATRTSLGDSRLYTITPKGVKAAWDPTACCCSQLWVIDGANVCHLCGTVYGIVVGFTFGVRATKGFRPGRRAQ